jgi:cytosine/adenosine deaminase-related metal-dependent hydrolase
MDAMLELLLRNRGADARILITGGTVVTMDADLGDFAVADVLIEHGMIVAVGPDLGDLVADGACIVVPADGMIVMPGLQDTHRHCWQTQFRRLISGCDLAGYEAVTHRSLGPHYAPEDMYAGTLLGALGALDAGVTSLLDFSHNSRSTAHADAAVDALVEAGIRAAYTSAPALSGTWDEQWPGDLVRLRDERFGSDDQLLSLRAGVFGEDAIAGASFALSPQTLRIARDLGIAVAADAVFGRGASENIERLGAAGLLGPDITLIHCNDLTDDAWRMIADAGVNVSLCPTSDPQLGIVDALPPIQKAIDFGVPVGLSVDVECSLSTDMFAQMQSIFTTQRMWAYHRGFRGDPDPPAPLEVRAVLEMATVHGARTNGVLDRSGVLSAGRQADIVLLSAEAINTMPLNNAISTIVLGAHAGNVDAVFVAGQPRKWRGQLVGHDLDRIRRLVHESRDRLVKATGYPLDVVSGTPRIIDLA